MRILIVDRNVVIRAGMNSIIKGIGGNNVFDAAENINAALLMIKGNDYDVVLIGLSLPELEGFEILEEIRRNWPCLPVVVVGMNDNEQLAVKAYVLGADGFVEVAHAEDDLVRAIEKVAKGRKFTSEKMMEAVVASLRTISLGNQDLPRLNMLSSREQQVADLLVDGATNKEIAWQLAINVKTVSTYKTRVLSKLKLKNLAELVKYKLS